MARIRDVVRRAAARIAQAALELWRALTGIP
jgi:hypothetical protein